MCVCVFKKTLDFEGDDCWMAISCRFVYPQSHFWEYVLGHFGNIFEETMMPINVQEFTQSSKFTCGIHTFLGSPRQSLGCWLPKRRQDGDRFCTNTKANGTYLRFLKNYWLNANHHFDLDSPNPPLSTPMFWYDGFHGEVHQWTTPVVFCCICSPRFFSPKKFILVLWIVRHAKRMLRRLWASKDGCLWSIWLLFFCLLSFRIICFIIRHQSSLKHWPRCCCYFLWYFSAFRMATLMRCASMLCFFAIYFTRQKHK